jgi:hypothetical protein
MIASISVSNTLTLNTVFVGRLPQPFFVAGSTHLLSRMPGLTGMYLALTGHTLGMGDLLYTGLATHAVSLDEVAPLQQVRAQEDDKAAGKWKLRVWMGCFGWVDANTGWSMERIWCVCNVTLLAVADSV